jgi:protein-tyrosine-phosphatase/DNA-binding transcriptional ArsR family regulator
VIDIIPEIWSPKAPEVFKLLAHDARWHLLTLLGSNDLRVHELAAASGKPQNLVSYHLKQLRDAGLVKERRGDADNRDVYYHLDFLHLQRLLDDGGRRLVPRLSLERYDPGEPRGSVRVLFLCTHNSARSQMAEALMRARGPAALYVSSAGSDPGTMHPLAVQALATMGVEVRGQVPKHVDQFVGERFDYVITVCDRMREILPMFEGSPGVLHWSVADPAAPQGSKTDAYEVFRQTAAEIDSRVRFLLAGLFELAEKEGHERHEQGEGVVSVHGQFGTESDGRGFPARTRRRAV